MSSVVSDGATHKARSPPQPKYKLISDLPYATLKRLADRLDVPTSDGKDPLWRKMIEVMPDSPYDALTVERFGMNANHKSGSPAYALLTDMSNRGVSYDKLVNLLKDLNHFTALSELGHREDVRFLQHPVAAPAILGQQFRLECKAIGVPPPSFLWFKERIPLKDQCSPLLVLDKVKKEDEGSYCCRATNDVSVVFSNWAEVKVQKPSILKSQAIPAVLDEPQRPEILTQPSPYITVSLGQDFRLVVAAHASGALNYQWYHNEKALSFGVNNELFFAHARAENAGFYYCAVSSESGSSVLSDPAQVKVLLPDAAYRQPVDQVAYPDQYSPPPQTQLQTLFPKSSAMPMASYPSSLEGRMYAPPTHEPFLSYASEPGPPPTGSMPHFGYYPVIPPEDELPKGEGQGQGQDRQVIAGSNAVADLTKACYDKVALLVGNKKYRMMALQLNTPENDTQDLAGILLSAGFKVVSLVNLTKEEMERALSFFLSLLGKNVYALFFFAGHGFEVHNMNYMMPVDAEMSKNPQHCLCAQKVLEQMQSRGTKLSIVLLDMCRVSAQPQVQFDRESLYYGPMSGSSGFFVYGFSCSHAQRAFEAGPGHDKFPEEERDNSIFVSALKQHFNREGSIEESIEVILSNAAKAVYERGKRDGQTGMAWQHPEVRHNLGEPLSLWDPIAPCEPDADGDRIHRATLWKQAHGVPKSIVLVSEDCQLVLRLHFQSEHSNVLIVNAELLNGCHILTRINDMHMELVPDTHPHLLRLKSEVYNVDSVPQGKSNRKDLMHFRIVDLQKIQSSTATLLVHGNYFFEKADGSSGSSTTTLSAVVPPPLYAKVVADPVFQQFPMQYGYFTAQLPM